MEGLHMAKNIKDVDHMPIRVSMGKSTLRANGGKLVNQYDSINWDQAGWNRSTQRSWKNNRKHQYK
jgi:hypothetical protein